MGSSGRFVIDQRRVSLPGSLASPRKQIFLLSRHVPCSDQVLLGKIRARGPSSQTLAVGWASPASPVSFPLLSLANGSLLIHKQPMAAIPYPMREALLSPSLTHLHSTTLLLIQVLPTLPDTSSNPHCLRSPF
jgi:hypothetical protein